jgi:hypothetical protein
MTHAILHAIIYYEDAEEICAKEPCCPITPGIIHRCEDEGFIFVDGSAEEPRRTSPFAYLPPFERSRQQGYGRVSANCFLLERWHRPAAVERTKNPGSDATLRRLVRYHKGESDRAVAATAE